uniref:REC114 meiotic recombination protein n=1 Tax=Esox lucius TaxID=8010 RepID=A0AAY5KDY4_ESOLU
MSNIHKSSWKLKLFGRFVPGSKKVGSNQWKMSEPSSENAGDLLLTIVESGHMLVSLGQELLGESRLVRMQFDGSSKAEALEECGSAVLRLKEYLPVTTKRGLAPAQPPPSQPTTQAATLDLQAVKTGPEIVQGSLSIARLTQHFLGEHALSLPLMYRHSTLRPGELEPFLRLCLLDPSFPAWVEEVEGELTRALQD